MEAGKEKMQHVEEEKREAIGIRLLGMTRLLYS